MKRVSPRQAEALISQEGYIYVDVRSVPEFEAGHPEGAYNIPLLEMGPSGMKPNPDFLLVVEATFTRTTKIVVGCKLGGRSLKAAQILMGAGFEDVVDQRAGFSGCRDAFGQVTEQGWEAESLPVSTQAQSGRDYVALKIAVRK